MKAGVRLLACGMALALTASACVGHKGARVGGPLRATIVVGDVTAQRTDGQAHTLHVGETISAGESIRTGPAARVRLEAGGGRALEFGAATSSTITSARGVAMDAGSALAETGGVPWTFAARGTGIDIPAGATRVELALGVLRVGVYAGGAHVDLVGRGVDVPAYHELEFAGGIPVERTARLLTLSDGDPWDRRLLGDVLEFDREITQFGKGFDNQFAGDVTDAVFYGSFVSVSNIASVTRCAASNEPSSSDELIALVFAERLDRLDGSRYRVRTNYCSMLRERAGGGTWGLIAKERGLPLQSLLQDVLDSIKRGTTPEASGGGGGGGGFGGGGGGNPSPQPTPKSTGSPKPHPTTSPSPGPSPSPTPTPCGTLERILGLCGGASSSSGSSGGTAAPNCTIVDALLDPNC